MNANPVHPCEYLVMGSGDHELASFFRSRVRCTLFHSVDHLIFPAGFPSEQ